MVNAEPDCARIDVHHKSDVIVQPGQPRDSGRDAGEILFTDRAAKRLPAGTSECYSQSGFISVLAPREHVVGMFEHETDEFTAALPNDESPRA